MIRFLIGLEKQICYAEIGCFYTEEVCILKKRSGLMRKIAGSLFITSLIIMFLGIALLYTRFRSEAVRMNRLLQESNLEIAGKNIVEKMDAAEYTAISLFFDKDMRNILLSKHAVEDPVGLHNQVYGNFLRILNAASSIRLLCTGRMDFLFPQAWKIISGIMTIAAVWR